MCSEGQQIHVWCPPGTSLSARKGQEDLPVLPVYVQLPFQLGESPPHIIFWCWFFWGDPEICCPQKGRLSLTQFVLQRKGGSFSSTLFGLIWWERAQLSAQLSSQYSCPLPKPHRRNWHREFWVGNISLLQWHTKKIWLFWVTGSSLCLPLQWKPWMIQTTWKSQHLLSHTPKITGLELSHWRNRNSKVRNTKLLFHRSHRSCGQGWENSFAFINKR